MENEYDDIREELDLINTAATNFFLRAKTDMEVQAASIIRLQARLIEKLITQK